MKLGVGQELYLGLSIKTKVIVLDKEDYPTNMIFNDIDEAIMDGKSYNAAEISFISNSPNEGKIKAERLIENIQNSLTEYRTKQNNLKAELFFKEFSI